jgi:hypothetical protein
LKKLGFKPPFVKKGKDLFQLWQITYVLGSDEFLIQYYMLPEEKLATCLWKNLSFTYSSSRLNDSSASDPQLHDLADERGPHSRQSSNWSHRSSLRPCFNPESLDSSCNCSH